MINMESVRLTQKSRRVRILHACLTSVLINIFFVYKYFGEPFVKDPFLRRWDFLKYWITNEPFVFLFSLIFVSLNVCLYICTGFILISPVVRMVLDVLKGYFTCRVRRRTWCFCNCSCKSLEKILTGIHDSHCDWEPQRPDGLDETTKQYLTSILGGCKDKFNIENMHYRLVGSSAEGLGKPYTLELNKGYADPLEKFISRFFCCCCPCSTAYTSLRTDFDVIMECSSTNDSIKDTLKVKYGNSSPGFVCLESVGPQERNNLSCLCKNVGGQDYLSSSAVRSNILEIVNDSSESQLPASRIFGTLNTL